MKSWRLVVTELGGDSALHEVTVDAGNWMSALTAGRAEIGEAGGVPTGASCAVAPDGKVTIHDPIARRTYVLAPNKAESFKDDAKTTPKVPAESVPRAKQNSAKENATKDRKSGKVAKKTMAYQAVDPKVVAEAAKRKEEADNQKKKTIAYQVAAPTSSGRPSRPPPPQPASQPPPQPAQAAKSAPAPAKSPEQASQPDKVGQPDKVSQPSKPAPGKAADDKPAAKKPVAPEEESGDGWRLLARRDEDPKPDSPLRYRERTFVVPVGTSSDTAEFVLRERFARLRTTLEQAPPGKFFNLAVFDHEWSSRPERPPIATLQWKDWKGEPAIAFPAASGAMGVPSGIPPVQSKPAPAATKPAAAKAPAPPPAPAAAPPKAPTPAASKPPAPEPAAAKPAAPQSYPAQPSGKSSAAAAAPPAGPARKRKRTTTDEQDARLAQAFEATQDLFFLSTPVEGLDFVINLLSELVPSEALSACLYDINADEFLFVSLRGPGAEERKAEAVPGSSGLLGAATERVGAALALTDVSADSRFDPGVDGRVGVDIRNVMYIPLHHQGRLFGMLQMLNRKTKDSYTPADANLATYIGKQTAEFLYQMRLAPDTVRAG